MDPHPASSLTPEETLFTGDFAQRRAALAELVERFSRRLFALARHMAGSADQAEELVQDAFVRLWQRAIDPPAGAPPVNKVFGYLRRVLVNLAIRQRPMDAAAGIDPDQPDPLDRRADDEPGAPEQLIRIESADRCLAAMATLPAEQRMVLALRVLEGRSYQQLADELGWPMGTVMSRLHRARLAVAAIVDPAAAAAIQQADSLKIRRSG